MLKRIGQFIQRNRFTATAAGKNAVHIVGKSLHFNGVPRFARTVFPTIDVISYLNDSDCKEFT